MSEFVRTPLERLLSDYLVCENSPRLVQTLLILVDYVARVLFPRQQVLIGGFIISDGGKTVFIDAKGPSLARSGVTNPVSATRIDLYRGSRLIASNNGWRNNANVAEIMASGLAPTDDRESALQVPLEPGAYTAVVSSGNGSTGIGLVEVYGVGSAVGY